MFVGLFTFAAIATPFRYRVGPWQRLPALDHRLLPHVSALFAAAFGAFFGSLSAFYLGRLQQQSDRREKRHAAPMEDLTPWSAKLMRTFARAGWATCREFPNALAFLGSFHLLTFKGWLARNTGSGSAIRFIRRFNSNRSSGTFGQFELEITIERLRVATAISWSGFGLALTRSTTISPNSSAKMQ
jgi:hypothetical protein